MPLVVSIEKVVSAEELVILEPELAWRVPVTTSVSPIVANPVTVKSSVVVSCSACTVPENVPFTATTLPTNVAKLLLARVRPRTLLVG